MTGACAAVRGGRRAGWWWILEGAHGAKPAWGCRYRPPRLSCCFSRGFSAGTEEPRPRLNKRMSELGLCSRREADAYIAAGLVQVDGSTVDQLGIRVSRQQRVALAPQAMAGQQSKLTVLLNKPVGFISGQPRTKRQRPAVRLLSWDNLCQRESWTPWPRGVLAGEWHRGLAPAGRLDMGAAVFLHLDYPPPVASLITRCPTCR